MSQTVFCPECGASAPEELLRCPACQAFLHDASPWQSDHNRLAIPIALLVGFAFLITHLIPDSGTNRILGNGISQAIVVVGVYAIVVLIGKFRATSRQIRAFRIVRQECVHGTTDWPTLLTSVHAAIVRANLSSCNTLLAYNRLYWLTEATKLPQDSRKSMIDSLRQHADTDWESLDSAFATTRYLVWLLPSAGFLGTVWGMTQALMKFSEATKNVSDVSFNAALSGTADGLGVAFDTTLVGLAMVIPVFLVAVLARRRAQRMLEGLDKYFIRVTNQVLCYTPIDTPKPPPLPEAVTEPLAAAVAEPTTAGEPPPLTEAVTEPLAAAEPMPEPPSEEVPESAAEPEAEEVDPAEDPARIQEPEPDDVTPQP